MPQPAADGEDIDAGHKKVGCVGVSQGVEAAVSGKTLQMHINILQFLHYYERYKKPAEKLNRILLLTPNEGLSRQHKAEFDLSELPAELFVKEGRTLFAGKGIEIIDIHKLEEEAGLVTVAVDSFEGNNLVLVDEGHRGAGGKDWKDKRDRLCEKGFSFEYSATFGQAIKAARNAKLEQEYTKCILFDYSYKFFYGDGYGKGYHILNLKEDKFEETRQLYLTACVLAFYQQMRIAQDKAEAIRPYLIEKPLWVFVGSSVNALRKERGRDISDVIDILLFLSQFLKDDKAAIHRIGLLLQDNAEMLDNRNRPIFRGEFSYLASLRLGAETVYADILEKVFNASTKGALHIENLKGSEGEIALKIGEGNEPFGVINVGDAPKLVKLCEDFSSELVVTEREFSDSFFRAINEPDSKINLLIGSKKFTEGWNSWRVSTMGLMNVGKGEGSEVIQLFGRGVRLKGIEYCLKRSSRLKESSLVPSKELKKPLEKLETLYIFGIRANYMDDFRAYLEEEGLTGDGTTVEFILPVFKTFDVNSKRLRILKLQDGTDFKKEGPKPEFGEITNNLTRHPVVVDWYPHIQSKRSSVGTDEVIEKHSENLSDKHLAFLDYDRLFFDLQDYKNEKGWSNSLLSRSAIKAVLHNKNKEWYTLYIPADALEVRRFEQTDEWREIALALLKKYCDRYYKTKQAEWESKFLEYQELKEDDPNLIDEYRFEVPEGDDDFLQILEELKRVIESKQIPNTQDFSNWNFGQIGFGRHLYQPLIYLRNGSIEVRPVALNEGEKDFVVHLADYCRDSSKSLQDYELYLLRNHSKSGMGFFEEGNFFPDFILWILNKEKQWVTFIDPKGLRQVDITDPKLSFFKRLKEKEKELGDENISLNSFIISNTPIEQLNLQKGERTIEDYEAMHILFQDPKGRYVEKLLKIIKNGDN